MVVIPASSEALKDFAAGLESATSLFELVRDLSPTRVAEISWCAALAWPAGCREAPVAVDMEPENDETDAADCAPYIVVPAGSTWLPNPLLRL